MKKNVYVVLIFEEAGGDLHRIATFGSEARARAIVARATRLGYSAGSHLLPVGTEDDQHVLNSKSVD